MPANLQQMASRFGPGAPLTPETGHRFVPSFDYIGEARATLDAPHLVCEQVRGWPGCIYVRQCDEAIGEGADGHPARLMAVAFGGNGNAIVARPTSSLPGSSCAPVR